MKHFGFTLATLVIIGLLGYGGYLALTSLKNPKSYMVHDNEKIGDLHKLATSTDSDSIRYIHETQAVTTTSATPTTASSTTGTSSSDNTLTSQLQTLIDQKIVIKRGSKGASVGSVQTFMNTYFKKSLKIDNDFGKTLEADVKKFQIQNKISATGQVGVKTVQAMIDWLQKNT